MKEGVKEKQILSQALVGIPMPGMFRSLHPGVMVAQGCAFTRFGFADLEILRFYYVFTTLFHYVFTTFPTTFFDYVFTTLFTTFSLPFIWRVLGAFAGPPW